MQPPVSPLSGGALCKSGKPKSEMLRRAQHDEQKFK
jgi:hypothetical protein